MMKKPSFQPYQQPFYLTESLGNNAFDYQQRAETHPEPQLRIAPLLELNNLEKLSSELAISHEIAFAAEENAQIKAFAGLKNFLTFKTLQEVPVYIFDNHNHAFYFWHLEKQRDQLKNNATLIHIDQHKDSRIPAEFLSSEDAQDLNKLFQYTNEILNVGNFIPPAFKTGLIKEMLLVDSEKSLQEFNSLYPEFQNSPTTKNLILDIDIDFFAPELDYIDNQKKLALIKQILPQAAIITIATSPFFIDQKLAIDWIKKIFLS